MVMTSAYMSDNALINYNSSFGHPLSSGGSFIDITNCTDYYYHYWPTWYPSHHVCEQKSKIEQAFKIINKLMAIKVIEKELTVKQFITMINDVAEVL